MSADLSITKITPTELESLSPVDLVDLLRCLLHCEARALSIWSPDLDVSSAIQVPDGGMDGYWNNSVPDNHVFIPRSKTIYQCKAQKVTDASIKAELLEKPRRKQAGKKSPTQPTKVKPRVREVLEAGGCYAILTTDHGIKRSSNASQIEVAKKVLKSAGFIPPKEAKIIFINGSKLADWVNSFASAVALVRQRTKGMSGLHFFTVRDWAQQPLMRGQYRTNDVLERQKKRIREILLTSCNAVLRIACLSGLGKTRLALEALRASSPDDTHGAHLSENTVYLSFQDHGQSAINFVLHLASAGYKGIIVLDDCPADVHQSLINKVSSNGLALITIYHETEDANSAWQTISFAPDDIREVVVEMLRADPRSSALGDEAILRIAEFSQGFPKIAQLILDYRMIPPLSALKKPGGIASKLLGFDEVIDQELENVLSALSLFRRLGGSSVKLSEHLEFIRTTFVSHLSDSVFRKNIGILKEKRIIQEIAYTLIVTPRPLATAFAIQLIHREDPNKWRAWIESFSNLGLINAFAQRIEEIEFSDQATEIGKLLLDSGVPFANAEYLITGQLGARIFRALTVLNPAEALNVLEQSLADIDQAFLRKSHESRRDILQALETMVWHPGLFHRAAWILLRFAATENEHWTSNATGVFKGLFHLGLSGTQMPASERLPLLDQALEAADAEIRELAIDALGEGLSAGDYSRMCNTTLGGQRDAGKDWFPSHVRDQLDYWKACFLRLKKVIEKADGDSMRAKAKLAQSLRGIISTPLIIELEAEFRSLCERFSNFWPDAKDGLRWFANNRGSEYLVEHKAALDRWIGYLQPPTSDTARRIMDIVCRPGWHHQDDSEGTFIDISQQEAEDFADECSRLRTDLIPHLDVLLTNEQQQSFSFGAKIAKEHPDSDKLLQAALSRWPAIDQKHRNYQFLRGFSSGLPLKSRKVLLDQVATTDGLHELLVPLTSATPLLEADLKRVADAVIANKIPPNAIHMLAYGSVTRKLAPNVVLKHGKRILRANPKVAPELFEIIWMYRYQDQKKFLGVAPLLAELILHPDMQFTNRLEWEWSESAIQLIHAQPDQTWYLKLSETILRMALSKDVYIANGELQRVTQVLLQTAPKIVWPVFAKAMQPGKNSKLWRLCDFLSRSGGRFDDSGCPLWDLPPAIFRSWLRKNAEIVPLMLRKMSLTRPSSATQDQKDQSVDGPFPLEWHPHALILLEEGTSEADLFSALVGNLLSFGSVGSRIPYLNERLKLVSDLDKDKDQRLRRIAQKVKKALISDVELEKQRELSEKAQHM